MRVIRRERDRSVRERRESEGERKILHIKKSLILVYG